MHAHSVLLVAKSINIKHASMQLGNAFTSDYLLIKIKLTPSGWVSLCLA